MSSFFEKPQPLEFEISLFGPGYGECIVIHYGFNRWIIIDSCINPETKSIAIIEYLNKLKINLADAVTHIVATHWHEDHIKGLSEVVKICSKSNFICPDTINTDQFLSLAYFFNEKIDTIPNFSLSVSEFRNILSILKERNTVPNYAGINKTLISNNINGINFRMKSLSPTDYEKQLALIEYSKLLNKSHLTLRNIPKRNPNLESTALQLIINQDKILLGADQGSSKNTQRGWDAIIDNSIDIDISNVYKVAHHGGKNGDNPRIWNELVDKNSYALISPWNKSDGLPQKMDILRINEFTSEAYISSYPYISTSPASRDIHINKHLKRRIKKIYKPINKHGHIQMRKHIHSDTWNVKLDGNAKKLSDIQI